jgi:hypothetical protein
LSLFQADDGQSEVTRTDSRRYSKIGEDAQRLWLCATAEEWMSS